jgi:hypothetical protein
LIVNYHWDIPVGHPQGITEKLIGGWSISGVTTIQSGAPLNIVDTKGGGIYGFAGVAVSMAEFCPGKGVADIRAPGSVQQGIISGTSYINKTAANPTFCSSALPSIGGSTGWGSGGLGTITGPRQNNWDISFAKMTKVGGIREDASLQFRAEFFNAFNHPQFSNPAVNVNSAAFGTITTASVNPRLIQFGLKYLF